MLRTPKRAYYMVVTAAVAASYPYINRALMPPWHGFKEGPRTENRTAIVTGATGNLGLAITFHLAMRKVRVIMACKDMELCKAMRREIVMKTKSNNITCRHLDLEDVDSINKFVKEMEQTEPHIDILINNAAVKKVDKKELTKYAIEKNYFVNFLAPFLLTFRLMDKLKESAKITRDSRVINVIGTPCRSWFKSFDVDDINFDKRGYKAKLAYEQSKLALAYFTILLNQFNRNQKNNVYVYGTSPCFSSGRFGTSFFKPASQWDNIKESLSQFYTISPDRAVMTTVKCALEPSFTDAYYSGKLFTWWLTHWGWHGVDKDENKAKIVWNRATEMLIELPDPVKVISSEESEAKAKDSSKSQIKNEDS